MESERLIATVAYDVECELLHSEVHLHCSHNHTLRNPFFSHRRIQFHASRWQLQHWVRPDLSITVTSVFLCFDPRKFKCHWFWFFMVLYTVHIPKL